MTTPTTRRAVLGAGLGLIALPALHAQTAADFPNRPMRLIVPFPPGGSTDTIARLVAQKLSEQLGQPVVLDNKPGAGGNIGMDAGAKATPDGYTLFLTSTSTASVNPTLYARLPFDPDKDIQHVALLAYVPNLLVVNANFPAQTVRELITVLKANPGKYNYASPGAGNSSHLTMEMFKTMAGVEVTHVPYKGDVPAITDLIAGQVQMMFMTSLAAAAYLKDSRLRAMAVASPRRLGTMPNLPTVAEAGLADFDGSAWFGLSTQAAVPRDIVAKVNAATNRVMQLPDVRQRLEAMSVTPAGGTPQEYSDFVAKERKKWGEVVKRSGAKAE
jgi:tripartite-type tricarboxylate transporter receptor subunit TctC